MAAAVGRVPGGVDYCCDVTCGDGGACGGLPVALLFRCPRHTGDEGILPNTLS